MARHAKARLAEAQNAKGAKDAGSSLENTSSPLSTSSRAQPHAEQSRLKAKRSTTSFGSVVVDFVSELTVFDAYELSRRFNLPTGQVTQAWKMFKRYDVQDVGILSSIEFQTLIRSVLRDRFPKASDIPREVFDRAVAQGDNVTFLGLLEWMTENSFSEQLLLSSEQRILRDIARQCSTTFPEVESIKQAFDRFDQDSTGNIDYAEFKDLLHVLLGVKDVATLPEARIGAFWRELDNDGSGHVNLKEFIPWYLTYFHGDAEASPVEAYYRKIRPVPFPFSQG